MSEKVELKEKIQAVDQNIRELWDALDEDNQKLLRKEFFILNRYISSVKSRSREEQEHYVITVNEYYNKNWNTLQAHPKLLWMLLCLCSYNGEKTFYHEWIGLKIEKNKKVQLLELLYPQRKRDELILLSKINTDTDLRKLARQHGLDKSEIDKYFK